MDIEKARFNLVEQQIRTWDVLDQDVLDLLFVVKREDYVPAVYRTLAFSDMEIPLGHGQAMLQPKLEARLLQEAKPRKTDKVLEIGTGSGYMTALLAHTSREVISVDIIPEFTQSAAQKLAAHGLANVVLETGDASHGWEKHAPYDLIMMTGSQPVLPASLLAQLTVGGRLVGIVGDPPVMRGVRIERLSEAPNGFHTTVMFDIVVPPLMNAAQPERFIF